MDRGAILGGRRLEEKRYNCRVQSKTNRIDFFVIVQVTEVKVKPGQISTISSGLNKLIFHNYVTKSLKL